MIEDPIDSTNTSFFFDTTNNSFNNYIVDKKVRISGSKLKWAEGMTGIVQDVISTDELSFDPGMATRETKVKVLLNDMDRSKPPYGIVVVPLKEIEFIHERTEEPPEEVHKPDKKSVIQKLGELATSGFLSNDYHDAIEDAITLINTIGGEENEFFGNQYTQEAEDGPDGTNEGCGRYFGAF